MEQRGRAPERPQKSERRYSIKERPSSRSISRARKRPDNIVTNIVIYDEELVLSLVNDKFVLKDKTHEGVRYSKTGIEKNCRWYAFLHPKKTTTELIKYFNEFVTSINNKEIGYCNTYVYTEDDIHLYIEKKSILETYKIINTRKFFNTKIMHIKMQLFTHSPRNL